MKKYYLDELDEQILKDIYYVVDDGYYRHNKFFCKITKAEKEKVEKAYRELLSDYVYIDEREGAMYEELTRDPWECTFQYVAEFGLRPTEKHDYLNVDETYKYLKKMVDLTSRTSRLYGKKNLWICKH